MPEVSVLIPLYGQHRGHTSLERVSEAWLSQHVPCEVVVAAAGAAPVQLGGADVDDRIVRVARVDESVRAPGRLRNVAAELARAPLLYLSDADVLPLGRDFLTRAIEAAGSAALSQPWMYRLLDDPGPNPVDLQAPDPLQCCYVAATEKGQLEPYGDERIVRDLLAIGGDEVDAPTVVPPRVARERFPTSKGDRAPFHWGGLMLERRLFDDVGGYCEHYHGWGCEDDDLLVKVASRHPVIRAWQVGNTLSCLHFDHPYPYRGTPERDANVARYRERVRAGAAAMIADDRRALHTSRRIRPVK